MRRSWLAVMIRLIASVVFVTLFGCGKDEKSALYDAHIGDVPEEYTDEAVSVYILQKDGLDADASVMYRLFHTCEHEKCYLAVMSDDQEYLVDALARACTAYDFYTDSPADVFASVYVAPDYLQRVEAILRDCEVARKRAIPRDPPFDDRLAGGQRSRS